MRHHVRVFPYYDGDYFLGCEARVRQLRYPDIETEAEIRKRSRFDGFLSTTARTQPVEWKTSAMLDIYNKRGFQNTVVGVDQSEVRADFENLFNRLDSDDDDADDDGDNDSDDDDEMYYEGTARSFNLISTQDLYKGVRVFKVLIKTENHPAIVLGDSRLSLGLETMSPNSPGLRYMWNVSQHVLTKNDFSVKFLPIEEVMDQLDDAWFGGGNNSGVLEFILAIDLDQALLRFGCNNRMFDYVLPIARDQWYTVKVDYGKACEALMLLEVFNQPKTLKETCCQYLLSIYQEQADDVFSRFTGEDEFIQQLLDGYYFEFAGDKNSEREPMLKARKALVQAFKLTIEKPFFAHELV